MKFNKLALATLTAAMVAGFTSCSDDDDDKSSEDTTIKYYATTDMTWAEFYAGELSESASALESEGYDAVTAATTKHPSQFTACVLADSSTITGVKAVNVGMTETVYNKLSETEKSRFHFLNDTTLSEYKQYNADGSFGKTVNATADKQTPTAVSLTCGFDARWSNYVISMTGLDLTGLKDSLNNMAYLQGAILTTSDGSKYGLKPMNNLWLNASEVGFSIKEFNEVHGYAVAYKHTASLEGKTITNLTYILKDKPNISIDMNVLVKKQTSATVSVNGSVAAGTDVNVNLAFSGVPSDANYTIAKVQSGSGRGAKTLTEGTDYSYSNGVLTLNGTVAAGSYSVSFADDTYANIGASITVE